MRAPSLTLRPLAISEATVRARWRALPAASAWGAFSSLRLQSIWPDWLAPALTARSRVFAASSAGGGGGRLFGGRECGGGFLAGGGCLCCLFLPRGGGCVFCFYRSW